MQQTQSTAQRVTLVTVNTKVRDEAEREWVLDALCRTQDPDQLFVTGADQREAATLCRQCPVMHRCAAEALDNNVEYGVWGGLTERERRALLKKHPDVDSWSDFLYGRNIRAIKTAVSSRRGS